MDNLPDKIYINVNNEIIDINNSDKNLNKLQERFILANIPNQNIKKMLNLKKVDDYKEKYLKENKFLIIKKIKMKLS